MQAIISLVIPFVLMFGIMYLLLIRPEKKRAKVYNEMLSDLKVNDEILTRGGIVGKIITLEDDQLVLQTGPDRVKMRITKNAIAQKLTKDSE